MNTLNFAEPRIYAVNRASKPGVMVCTFCCHREIFHRACCLACSLVSDLQAFLLQMDARCKMLRTSDADFLSCSMCRFGIVFCRFPLHIAATDTCYSPDKLFPSGGKLCSCSAKQVTAVFVSAVPWVSWWGCFGTLKILRHLFLSMTFFKLWLYRAERCYSSQNVFHSSE